MKDTSDKRAVVLRELLAGLDLASADGRAGIMALLREVEAAAPGSVPMMVARLERHRLKTTAR
ncbi:hypothetical protein [Brevundimonas lenta]|uniref:Uncharacterized protein n=1 Tax=Brevundimonas lenta TaxID=424796 RepID=A0A7W6JA83_9CAUL|nr:hypothetical protein [Brevundimonas lenta]MBB4081415.1 hypothetical protein [Brevundimonas lenta]